MECEQIKRIKNEDSQINISISEGYCTKRIHIEKEYLLNGKLEKIVNFHIWDDILFSAYLHDRDLYLDLIEISFEIDIEDQIYFALNRMLGKDISLDVYDDRRKENKNYMRFKRINNKIIITFHDEDKDEPLFKRFSVFIKNIGLDPRSKMEDFNIKYRLVRFFREAVEILTNDNHQYTLDECFEILKQQGIYDGENPFFHITNRCLYIPIPKKQSPVKKIVPNNKKQS